MPKKPRRPPVPIVIQQPPIIKPPERGLMTITQDGLVITMTLVTSGQYVDGSWWVVAPAAQAIEISSVAIDSSAIGSGYTYIGGVMVDPHGLDQQGWDNRFNSTNTFGPGMIYDASLARALPLTVGAYSDGTPKTVWFYRGWDAVQEGGQYTGCYAIVQITLVSAIPAANSIKPPGMYCAGGKPQKTTANINYSAISPVTIPVGAVEPNWTGIRLYLKRPLVITGYFGAGSGYAGTNTSLPAVCNPTMTQIAYPAYQSFYTNSTILGAISTSASRTELINRIVRDGMEMYAALAFSPSAYEAGAGYGTGRTLMYLAGVWLGDTNMQATPATHFNPYVSLTVPIAIFQEDGMSFIGNPDGTYPSGRPLYGTIHVNNWNPAGPFTNNHDSRDVTGAREPYWITLAAASGTAQGGGVNTITLDASASFVQSAVDDMVYIVSGTGAGGAAYITSYNSGTKVATVDRNWGTAPAAGSVYEIYNAGVEPYQYTATANNMGAAIALVLAGKAASFGADAFIAYSRRYMNDSGKLIPRYVVPAGVSWYDSGDFWFNYRCFSAEEAVTYNGAWVRKWWDASITPTDLWP